MIKSSKHSLKIITLIEVEEGKNKPYLLKDKCLTYVQAQWIAA
jgi:predicted HTH transcriptional regulator